jgi:subtilisin family serine protease
VTRPGLHSGWSVAACHIGVRLRPLLPILLFLGLLAAPGARALDLPVRDPRRQPMIAPAYVADRFTLQLAPAAALRAWTARAAGVSATVARLGVPFVDAAAAGLGVWLEPEFRGETPPPAGSRDPDFTAFYIAHLPEGTDLERALVRFRALADVRRADPIAVLPVSATPDDSLWSLSWWHHQPSGCDIHTPEAWDVTTGDTSIVVAILDTGVIPYHPDLGGTVAGSAGQIWTNWAEKSGLPGVDDDGNGFADDSCGWDFVNRPNAGGIPPFEDWQDEDNDPNDYAGHGTMVAGIVGAIANNHIGVAGTAWKVRLMPLRLGWVESGYPNGLVDMSYAAQAIRYATRMGASVINCSFDSDTAGDLIAALDAATRGGVVVVAASAGTIERPSYIASREDVITVTASDMFDRVSSSALRGEWVDLAAPGLGILSTYVRTPTWYDSLGYRQPAYTRFGLSGTSFSAPLAAGTVALIEARQKALGLRPLPPMGAKLRLRETADDISALNTGTGYGTGRLNAYRALVDRVGSTAWQGGAASVGPAVPIPLTGPARKLAYATSDGKLLIQDWLTGDTLALAPLPGAPVRQLAASELGGGHGIGFFVGTGNGALAGVDTTGASLPGFPVTTSGGSAALTGGPALGDLDGDGTLEAVCGADDGRLWAWRANGAVATGFPALTSAAGIGVPIALTDLDGQPGVEILAATRDGNVYAVDGSGVILLGWPAMTNPSPFAPVVTRIGRETVVLVAAGSQVVGLRSNGTERSRWALPGLAASDPALGDLDGDGTDEIVVPVGPPSQVVVLDSTGTAPAGMGWPCVLASAPLGPPVLGHLQGGSAPGVVLMRAGGLVALSDSARAIPVLPKPGGAGVTPMLADLAGDGAMKLAAGSGNDSSLYVYDLGAGSASVTPQAWPTPRGNCARTGSHLYLSPDALPPAPVSDLAARFESPDSLRLVWTATGDDGVVGRAASYDVRLATFKSDVGSASRGNPLAAVPVPDSAGASQSVTLRALAPGVTCWIWLRVMDAAGNVSRCSNVVRLTMPLGPVRPAVAELAVRQRPSRAPVLFDWSGADATSIVLYDVSGRRVRALRLEPAAGGTAQWNGRDENGRLVPAGLYFARLTGGSLHAQTRVVLLP